MTKIRNGGFIGANKEPAYTSIAGVFGLKDVYLSTLVSNWPTSYPTGGVIYNDGTSIYHTFITSGTFKVPTTKTMDILVVAGGGGGGTGVTGYLNGGGVGGGGVVSHPSVSVVGGIYAIVIGSGGPADTVGNDTTALGYTASGGGKGGGLSTPYPCAGGPGGSGGGGSGGGYYGGAGAGEYWSGVSWRSWSVWWCLFGRRRRWGCCTRECKRAGKWW